MTEPDASDAQCYVCKDKLDPLLAPGFGSVWNGKVGYRCTDCEKLFCAVCIKGKGHVNAWQAPCTDAESEAWTKAVVEAPGLRRRVKELESEADERRTEFESLSQNFIADQNTLAEFGRELESLRSQAAEREALLARGAELIEQDLKEIEGLRAELAATKQAERATTLAEIDRLAEVYFDNCAHGRPSRAEATMLAVYQLRKPFDALATAALMKEEPR